jgi:hypothetical protein
MARSYSHGSTRVRRWRDDRDKAQIERKLASLVAFIDGIEYLQVRQADIASLSRQEVFDLLKLRSCDLHATNVARTRNEPK